MNTPSGIHPHVGFVNGGTGRFRANVIHTYTQVFTGSYPQQWTTRASFAHRCGRVLGKSMWTDTERHKVIHGLWTLVDFLLKTLGTTCRLRPDAVHRAGDKPRG